MENVGKDVLRNLKKKLDYILYMRDIAIREMSSLLVKFVMTFGDKSGSVSQITPIISPFSFGIICGLLL